VCGADVVGVFVFVVYAAAVWPGGAAAGGSVAARMLTYADVC
jgi:hypothetical protein